MNENKCDEMKEIAQHHHQLIPIKEYSEEFTVRSTGITVKIPKARIHPVLFGGDQLTAAMLRSARQAKVHEDSPGTRLEGLVPMAEDWHTKMNTMGVGIVEMTINFDLQKKCVNKMQTMFVTQVVWKNFYSSKSSADHGTLYQFCSKLNWTNVVKNPKNDFNACEDFFMTVTTGHIAAACEILYMCISSHQRKFPARLLYQTLRICG